jgi:predicted DNA binding protein
MIFSTAYEPTRGYRRRTPKDDAIRAAAESIERQYQEAKRAFEAISAIRDRTPALTDGDRAALTAALSTGGRE